MSYLYPGKGLTRGVVATTLFDTFDTLKLTWEEIEVLVQSLTAAGSQRIGQHLDFHFFSFSFGCFCGLKRLRFVDLCKRRR